MINRDFKGIWIQKDIWLDTRLSAIEKVVLAEINSLDNENHCIASNDYFADFCQVSSRTISASINKLINLGYVEVVSFNGRQRVLKISSQTRKICEADSQNLHTNNIVNNKNTTLSKDNVGMRQPEFNFGIPNDEPVKNKKKTNDDEYIDACLLIDNFTDDLKLRVKLKELFSNRVEMCSKERHHFYASTCKHYLDELKPVTDKIGAVNLSLQYGNTLKVMTPYENKPFSNYMNPPISNPDTNKAPQHKADLSNLSDKTY